ncbi:AAA family ATPase [Ruegeria arenilitoris]|uniref:AAA family ATPase n=1 Tax=Ruegeria arenilitoris TaxID=1173585 RepID=UPI0020C324D7|nr:AAA family ATPase [Ruegeria arenilitoris]
MSRFNPHEHAAPVYEAASVWVQNCLEADGSLFLANKSLWTKELFDELDLYFVQNLDEGEGNFYEKLEAQLSRCSSQGKQLMAEVTWLLLLFASRITPEKKRSDIQLIWSWSDEDLDESHHLLTKECLGGIGHTGTAYNTHRWREYVFFINAMRDFKSKSLVERRELTNEPWKFNDWLLSVVDGENRQLRHILTHLVFPDSFERISSFKDKKMIVSTLRDIPLKEVNKWELPRVDHELLNLREEIEKQRTDPIDFYLEEFVAQWRPTKTKKIRNAQTLQGSSVSVESNDEPVEPVGRNKRQSLNTILYGPPGTGKTYETARRAVAICDGQVPATRSKLMKRYAELQAEKRVEFVTFHQNYSYEEFVEGLRPETGDEDSDAVQSPGFRLAPRSGVLKRIAERAKQRPARLTSQSDYSDKKVFKISLGRAWNPEDDNIRAEAYEEGIISLGYGGEIDWSDTAYSSFRAIAERWREEPGEAEATGKNPNIEFINQLRNELRVGDIVVASQGNRRFRAVGVVTGEYEFDLDARYPHRRKVEWRWQSEDEIGLEVGDIYESNFSQQSIYQLYPKRINWPTLLAYLEPDATSDLHPAHVLIIDEINRANISKVLGELITLLEEDKRIGALNELTVSLPYSGEAFSLPSNLHIVGTMNTADRSIALLDTALRRRFVFEELPPKYEVLEGMVVEGIPLDQVLKAINQRLEWFLGADHLIGHGYFTDVQDLSDLDGVIGNKVVPLLREYFHEDLGRVRAILGGGDSFLRRERIQIPPGMQLDYEEPRYRFLDNYLELGEYGPEAYDELLGIPTEQEG